MYAVRRWSVRHAKGLERLYRGFERTMIALDPLWRRIGYARLEQPVEAVERAVKGLLFDCQMCGCCVLSSTGLSCPMNCPKNLRNGPCGGVRSDGRLSLIHISRPALAQSQPFQNPLCSHRMNFITA